MHKLWKQSARVAHKSNLAQPVSKDKIPPAQIRRDSGTFTVSGTTSGQATNVTVNTSNALLYLDYTFASTNHTLANGTNTFTAIAKNALGRNDTNAITAYLPASVSCTYDLNGNLLNDGTRYFTYDDENQLISVTRSNYWRSEFVYDGQMRRRIRREKVWQAGTWSLQSETHYIYDGNLVVQERDINNLPIVTYTRGK